MLLFIASSLAVASLQSTAPPAAHRPRKDDPKEMVCIVERPVGSHIFHRYCATRAYWEHRQFLDQQALSPWGSHGTHGNGGSMGTSSGSGGGPG